MIARAFIQQLWPPPPAAGRVKRKETVLGSWTLLDVTHQLPFFLSLSFDMTRIEAPAPSSLRKKKKSTKTYLELCREAFDAQEREERDELLLMGVVDSASSSHVLYI
jgi:hypothetical protein